MEPRAGSLLNVEGYPILGWWTKRIASARRNPTTHAVDSILCVAGPSGGAPVPPNAVPLHTSAVGVQQ